ncbi:hypothetical protein Pcinc_026117, partial [Petrolisthes cinctipes]
WLSWLCIWLFVWLGWLSPRSLDHEAILLPAPVQVTSAFLTVKDRTDRQPRVIGSQSRYIGTETRKVGSANLVVAINPEKNQKIGQERLETDSLN